MWGEADQELVQCMMDRLVHRGPDGSGVFVARGGHGVLGHRRLAIMDPSGGAQPIVDDRRRSALIANGEIYNHRDLSRPLQRLYQFRTRSDSEAILHLFDRYQTDAAASLDGMFAFAIADGDQMFAARDPLGIKPLYMGRRQNAWCFASEQKALVQIAEDVREFPPGSWFHTAHGNRSYYRVPEPQYAHEPQSLEATTRNIRRTLEEAVGKRLMSDVPLGAFLSGGLDSSILVALARRQMDSLHTFSVGFEGSPDLLAARRVARHLDTIHHEYVLTEGEVMQQLPRIIYHLESFDQDLVRSAIPTYFTARLAAEQVKVVLTGEGADELFAGYRYHRSIPSGEELQRELTRSIAALHHINLQRVDRLTMAHGLEARVPFLDVRMIALAQQVPPAWKLRHLPDGRLVEKWILRKACEDLLPAEIVWRDKQQFDEGSGTADFAGRHGFSKWLAAAAAESYAAEHAAASLRSHEECAYHQILADAFPAGAFILENVARWSARPTNHTEEDRPRKEELS
jgi:asparagine synthase (glutamine-hydrolysing)